MQRPLSMPSFRKPMLGYVNMDAQNVNHKSPDRGFGEDSASDSSPLDEINGDEAAKEIVEESTRVAGIWDKSGGTHNGEEVQGLFSMLRVHFLRNFR
ncbi:hypothetical protein Ahy_A05g023240 isoform B [Arachis hypogaea]|uniref:Uncharacterized protein n=1 Tax=Arachis hypogaea TaxID=3818 RepID=A0A445D2Q7_ARAHY|nr:hypothetical protein Ahy_A05g023240 isoform B [Arachis hypogaea]